ncbi:MAG: excisionase family DNA-binding protein [Desulfosporosinus sp.]|nr:excisionase family DNA-binding protein [Desulfosporosinus sp.]
MYEAVTMKAKEAAVYVGISYWLLLEMTKKGELPFIAAGGRKLFRKESLDLWMANQEAQSLQTKPEPTGHGALRKVSK